MRREFRKAEGCTNFSHTSVGLKGCYMSGGLRKNGTCYARPEQILSLPVHSVTHIQGSSVHSVRLLSLANNVAELSLQRREIQTEAHNYLLSINECRLGLVCLQYESRPLSVVVMLLPSQAGRL